jgi:hypothetical protein
MSTALSTVQASFGLLPVLLSPIMVRHGLSIQVRFLSDSFLFAGGCMPPALTTKKRKKK